MGGQRRGREGFRLLLNAMGLPHTPTPWAPLILPLPWGLEKSGLHRGQEKKHDLTKVTRLARNPVRIKPRTRWLQIPCLSAPGRVKY